ncbi:MAG: J domain-containing protein [Proteobacteria bacterium]|nr:J domain-containing protein [Pseudomonadota bacterium]MBU1687910.1 J domain-containing protein [Pseudomonadota bacterium]
MKRASISREGLAKARKLLKLGQSATLAEIKKAFREQAKECHPDIALTDEDPSRNHEAMQSLNEAYALLMDYCAAYKIPLVPKSPVSDEEWWMNRFGNDPLWGPPAQTDSSMDSTKKRR